MALGLGKLLEGAAWFAALSLATVGALAFVPDDAWETFPPALQPARAKLADFGVAPTCYRVDSNANVGDEAGKTGKNGENGGGDWSTASEVRIGERWTNEQNVRSATWNERANGSERGTTELNSNGARTSASAQAEVAAQNAVAGENATGLAGANAGFWGGETTSTSSAGVGAAGDATENGAIDGGESWGGDAIPPFVENVDAPGAETAFNGGESAAIGGAETSSLSEVNGWERGAENPTGAENWEVAAGVDATNAVDAATATGVSANDFNVANDFNANNGVGGGESLVPVAGFNGESGGDVANGFNGGNGGANGASGLLAQADAAANDWNAPPVVGSDLRGGEGAGVAPVDEGAELRDALAAASVAATPEAIKTVFETLNRIRNERGRRLSVEDARALDAALDRLAFDVFYNPAQTILEPRWQTAPGDSLTSIAERLETTPETLAEINGIKDPVDAALPPGTSLKTVRGPATAEISIAKKELTLRFNGLYAGRFALGVPASSAHLRGDFRVVEKLANPDCDAVDANGQTIAIPGGAPENPLGVAWIALDGGVGLQGTNRPELVGQTIPENGGFVFSNREISQLSVLLPVGAVVTIVD